MPLALDTTGVLRALVLSGGAPLVAPASGEWIPVVELEEQGALLWPVLAESGALHCVVVAKRHREPRPGPLRKFRAIRYHFPVMYLFEEVAKGHRDRHGDPIELTINPHTYR